MCNMVYSHRKAALQIAHSALTATIYWYTVTSPITLRNSRPPTGLCIISVLCSFTLSLMRNQSILSPQPLGIQCYLCEAPVGSNVDWLGRSLSVNLLELGCLVLGEELGSVGETSLGVDSGVDEIWTRLAHFPAVDMDKRTWVVESKLDSAVDNVVSSLNTEHEGVILVSRKGSVVVSSTRSTRNLTHPTSYFQLPKRPRDQMSFS